MIDKQLALAKILCSKYRGGVWEECPKETQDIFSRQAMSIINELGVEGIYLREKLEI